MHLSLKEKIIHEIKYICIAIIIAMLFRSLFYEPYMVPSGSMKPNLLHGDYMFVSKFSYGYSKYSFPFYPNIFQGRIFFTPPKFGDIIVFKNPNNLDLTYVKRLVGLPGDKIQIIDGQLLINDRLSKYQAVAPFKDDENNSITDQYYEYYNDNTHITLLKKHFNDNFGPVIVPMKMYFALGDNRDNSYDSRFASVVGLIPEDHLIGKPQIIFYSTNSKSFWPIIPWLMNIRFDRLFKIPI